MQVKQTDSQTPTSSRASSFFIENLLGSERSGQEAQSDKGKGRARHAKDSGREEIIFPSRVLPENRGEMNVQVPSGYSPAAPSPHRDSSLQWYRGVTALNFRASGIPSSEY